MEGLQPRRVKQNSEVALQAFCQNRSSGPLSYRPAVPLDDSRRLCHMVEASSIMLRIMGGLINYLLCEGWCESYIYSRVCNVVCHRAE